MVKDIPISTWVTLATLLVTATGGWFTLKYTVQYLTVDIARLQEADKALKARDEKHGTELQGLREQILRLEYRGRIYDR